MHAELDNEGESQSVVGSAEEGKEHMLAVDGVTVKVVEAVVDKERNVRR